jgi:thiamine biosynthesis lipoprotein
MALASVVREGETFTGRFTAMASPCEVLVDTADAAEARAAAEAARAEAARIEEKFSRYRADSVVGRIHRAEGAPVAVDEETAQLLDYAAQLHQLSGGRFDITSGALRRAWTFDGSDRVPAPAVVAEALRHVGWSRVGWRERVLTLPAGMEIDLGGIGKEYAVDRAAVLVAGKTRAAFLVNFGGDLYASGARTGGRPWAVGVEDPDQVEGTPLLKLEITRAAVATSGDARRFVRHQGRRLGHVLDPVTGWPVADAPRSVTVLATTCLEAGTLATLAMLQGAGARAFLEAEGVRHWIF